MKGRSQGNPYPGHSSSDTSWVSRKHPVNCGDAENSWACREREIEAQDVCQNRTGAHFSDASGGLGHAVPRAVPARRRARRAGVQRAAFADGEIALEYACARSQRAEARKARRQWIVTVGETSAETPMWTSRDGWLTELSAWLATDEGLAECARLHVRPEVGLRVPMVLAAHADHASGRHCAVANATVAQGAGYSERTVTTVRKLLSASGLAVEIRRGTGSTATPGYGRRPSIWHLVSRPKPVDKPAFGAAVCDLPPSRSDRRLSPARDKSPNARTRAAKPNSHPPKKSPTRRGRCAPRPLAVQRLAAELVGSAYGRNPLCVGLDRGHIGTICEAIMSAGIDPAVWSADQIKTALEADMKARHGSWPDSIERPGAFLASRLRRLPVRPVGAHRGGVTAASLDSRNVAAPQDSMRESREATKARTQRWCADVTAATTPQERETLLRAHEAKFGPAVDPFAALANAGRRSARLYPDLPLVAGLMRWAGDVLGDEPTTEAAERMPATASLSADLLMDLAIGTCDCVVCGSPNAPQRPQLPLRAMSTVCDQCWPVIAAELAQASDIDEGMLA